MSNGFHIEPSTTRMDEGRRSNTLDEKKQALGSSNTFPGSNLLNRNRNVSDLLADLPRPPEWQAGAPCASVGDDFWFPEKGGTTSPAKRICATCDVREVCLQYALDNNERFGIWGGKSERERRQMLQQRGDDAA